MKRYNSISFGFALASLMLGVTGCTSSPPPPPIAVEDTVVAEAPIEATVEPTDVPVLEEPTATPPPLDPTATSIPAEPTDSDGVAVAETEEAAAEDVSPDAEVESPATDELIAVATIDVTYFTPAQTEGPYYPVEKPVDQDNDLTNVAGAAGSPAGQVIEFTGTVYDATGTPIEGLTVEIWQTDDNGVYLHPNDPGTEQRDRNFQFYGESTTGADGRYSFRTILPGHYEPRPRHIHVKIKQGEQELMTTQIYFDGDPTLANDGVFLDGGSENEHLVMRMEPGQDANGNSILVGEHDIILDVELSSS